MYLVDLGNNHPDQIMFPHDGAGLRSCNPYTGSYSSGVVPLRFNPVVLSEVDLPNGHSYQFKYNQYGEITKIIEYLADGKCESNADWKYRFKENSDKMRTGSLMEVAGVLKSLLQLAQTKPLSFREKKMLERARYLLVSELAMAKNWEEPEVEEALNKALSKSKLRFPEASALES